MKRVLCLPLAMFLVIGCGTVNRNNDTTLHALQSASDQTPTSVQNQAQTLNTQQLPAQLSNAANNPNLTPTQAAALANPKNQKVIAALVELAKGGSTASRQTAAMGLMSAAASSGIDLTSLMTLLQTIAPIIMSIDPQLAPFIQVAETILPIVISIFGGGTTGTTTGTTTGG